MDTPEAAASHYRREAIGAFAHDLRTPLTALRMAVDIGRQLAGGDTVTLDEQLVGMVEGALAEIEALADALHEASRLERGKLTLGDGPADLGEVLAAAQAQARGALTAGAVPAGVSGPWDGHRLAGALASVAASVVRLAGTETATLAIQNESPLELEVRAGAPGAGGEPFAAGAGFRYFHARQLLEAMGGRVVDQHGAGFALVRITLPR